MGVTPIGYHAVIPVSAIIDIEKGWSDDDFTSNPFFILISAQTGGILGGIYKRVKDGKEMDGVWVCWSWWFRGFIQDHKPNEPKNHRKSILPASTRLDPPELTAFPGFDHQRINYASPSIFFQ